MYLTNGAEVSRGISALAPKCADSSAPVKIWCRIVSRHFGTIMYWCRTVLVPKCPVSDAEERFASLSATAQLLVGDIRVTHCTHRVHLWLDGKRVVDFI